MVQKTNFIRVLFVGLIVLVFAVVALNDEEADENVPPFIPTHEWQKVEKGQTVPAGLHIRMNFETGVREAKLLDPAEGTGSGQLQQVQHPPEQDSARMMDPVSIIRQELQVLQSSLNLNRLCSSLETLESLDRLDYARDIVTMGGATLILDALQHAWTREHLRHVSRHTIHNSLRPLLDQGMRTIGSLAQNNQQVAQDFAEHGYLEYLLSLAPEQELALQARAMYALSCIVRSSDEAQVRFEGVGGVAFIKEVLSSSEYSAKTKAKALGVVSDRVANGKPFEGVDDSWCEVLEGLGHEEMFAEDLLVVLGYIKTCSVDISE